MTVLATNTCRVCGCRPEAPCTVDYGQGPRPCEWMDLQHTLCSNVLCVARVPLNELLEMQAEMLQEVLYARG